MWRNAIVIPATVRRLPCVRSFVRQWSACGSHRSPEKFVDLSLLATYQREEVLGLIRTKSSIELARSVEAVAREHGGIPSDVGQRVVDQLFMDFLGQCEQGVGDEELSILLDSADTRSAVTLCNHALFTQLHALLTPAVLEKRSADYLVKVMTFLKHHTKGGSAADEIVMMYSDRADCISECLAEIDDHSVIVAMLAMIRQDTVTKCWPLVNKLCLHLTSLMEDSPLKLNECAAVVKCFVTMGLADRMLLSTVTSNLVDVARSMGSVEFDLDASESQAMLEHIAVILFGLAHLNHPADDLFAAFSPVLDAVLERHYDYYCSSASSKVNVYMLRTYWAYHHFGMELPSSLHAAVMLTVRRHGMSEWFSRRQFRLAGTLLPSLPATTWTARCRHDAFTRSRRHVHSMLENRMSVPGVTALPCVQTVHGFVDLVLFADPVTGDILSCDVDPVELFDYRHVSGNIPVAVFFQDPMDKFHVRHPKGRTTSLSNSSVLNKQSARLLEANWIICMLPPTTISLHNVHRFTNAVQRTAVSHIFAREKRKLKEEKKRAALQTKAAAALELPGEDVSAEAA